MCPSLGRASSLVGWSYHHLHRYIDRVVVRVGIMVMIVVCACASYGHDRSSFPGPWFPLIKPDFSRCRTISWFVLSSYTNLFGSSIVVSRVHQVSCRDRVVHESCSLSVPSMSSCSCSCGQYVIRWFAIMMVGGGMCVSLSNKDAHVSKVNEAWSHHGYSQHISQNTIQKHQYNTHCPSYLIV